MPNEVNGCTHGYLFLLSCPLRPDVLDLPRLVHWAVHRQGFIEGGFNGRTNKLVDGCYTTWQGGIFPLLQRCAPETLRQTGVGRAAAGMSCMLLKQSWMHERQQSLQHCLRHSMSVHMALSAMTFMYQPWL